MASDIRVRIDAAGADDEEGERLALQLREELRLLDVAAVEQLRLGAAPEGTRGVGAAAAAGLVVSLAPQLKTVGSVVRVIRDWLRRSPANRTVRLELDGDVLELTGTTSALQEELAAAWIQRHATVTTGP